MTLLTDLSTSQWTLEGLVEETNRLLPAYLPQDSKTGRLREDMTPRLVRHYATQGLLDEPQKAGRENRYGFRHLLQILALRRLQAEGYGGSALQERLERDDHELLALLEGPHAPHASGTDNPARDYLGKLRDQQPKFIHQVLGIDGPADPSRSRSPSRARPRWLHLDVEPGLQLNVADTFALPRSVRERQLLLERILSLLEEARRKP